MVPFENNKPKIMETNIHSTPQSINSRKKEDMYGCFFLAMPGNIFLNIL